MASNDSAVQLSVIIPVGVRHSDIASLYSEYADSLDAIGIRSEFIFVLDGPFQDVSSALEMLIAAGQRITIVSLTRLFGEATAIMAGFEYATGALVATTGAGFETGGAELGFTGCGFG